jgi:uncharacterized RDD family membrane protein YckC
VDPEAELAAQARLEADYLAGKLTADEYTERRRKLREGVLPVEEPSTELVLASWGRRAAALVLDSLLLVVASLTLLVALPSVDVVLAFLVVPFAYQWLMVGAWGQTLGKMALGVRVVRASGAPVGYGRAAGRVASIWALGWLFLPLLVAYLWPLWDRRHQTLYDKIVDTIVVRA